MLNHRLLCCFNLETTLVQYLAFAVIVLVKVTQEGGLDLMDESKAADDMPSECMSNLWFYVDFCTALFYISI